jgi:uncharacterized coiled-coil protein SlyX
MMSFQDVIQNYWQTFFLAPIAFVSHKIFSLNAKVAVHDKQIETLELAVTNLCSKHDVTNDLLRKLIGRFDEHLNKN